MSIPIYNVGDIVKLCQWHEFDEHISIPGPYWRGLMGKNLMISHVQNDSTYNLYLNGKLSSCIYYNFKNRSYGWAEEFLIPTYANFLSDEDFEI